MGVHGVYKAAKEAIGIGIADKVPSLLCAQQISCRPMVQAWDENSARSTLISSSGRRASPGDPARQSTKAYRSFAKSSSKAAERWLRLRTTRSAKPRPSCSRTKASALPGAGTTVAAIAKLAKRDARWPTRGSG